ncbi:NADP-dependent 3-hydroxy acid dehydrogenase YdfG [Roseovarius lutimaris]|uniref:NADP-dependent 3-hydroxy acid dehydrogenase YdfG n=1 Tax=Roseovarius lutimaris TaxID=1005928 RepID=A0A1I5E9C0_9RHOB|nr:SDR family oxidoreductase [Roseovarius lutimaris]SFO08104.1 NADP-dependent 3-hydroxy acid dehydrogenase YdfG [Roseovarius lutimaris]
MNDRIKSGIAVVTGAGGGLGRALVLELAARGMRVVALGRRRDGIEETAALAPRDSVEMLQVDVADAGAVREGLSQIADEVPITLLINNAAVYPRRDFLDETPDSFMDTVAINLGGMVNCSHAALEGMVEAGFGRIMNVSTFADIAPLPASSGYAVSKGAARILTRAMIADLADRFPDIVINDWMPGMLATRMGVAHGLDPAQSAKWGATLALWHDPVLTGTVFEQNREILPPRGIKGRVKDALLLRRRRPQMISG